MLNKDLEEIKNSQSVMNNAITGIKRILQGTSSRVTEVEERKNELENRTMEINEAEWEKKKKKKEMRTASETFGTMLNTPIFES